MTAINTVYQFTVISVYQFNSAWLYSYTQAKRMRENIIFCIYQGNFPSEVCVHVFLKKQFGNF